MKGSRSLLGYAVGSSLPYPPNSALSAPFTRFHGTTKFNLPHSYTLTGVRDLGHHPLYIYSNKTHEGRHP